MRLAGHIVCDVKIGGHQILTGRLGHQFTCNVDGVLITGNCRVLVLKPDIESACVDIVRFILRLAEQSTVFRNVYRGLVCNIATAIDAIGPVCIRLVAVAIRRFAVVGEIFFFVFGWVFVHKCFKIVFVIKVRVFIVSRRKA